MKIREYGLATFRVADALPRAGLAVAEQVAAFDDLVAAFPGAGHDRLVGRSVLDLLHDWEGTLAAIDSLLREINTDTAGVADAHFRPFSDVIIRPPVDLPRQVFCAGANYRTHVIHLMVDMGIGPEGLSREERQRFAEDLMDAKAANGAPYVFTKPVTAVAGAFDDLEVPALDEKPDWELELAVVIGRGGRNIARSDAMSHIAGYAIANDVTCRALIQRTDDSQIGLDWLRSKGQPGFLPFGPVLVPARFVAEPARLHLGLSVNGQLMQNEDATDMIFDISRLIEHVSRYTLLLPGDVICTGSPAGNGTHYNRFLQPGDLMVGEITGLGRQVIRCIAPAAA